MRDKSFSQWWGKWVDGRCSKPLPDWQTRLPEPPWTIKTRGLPPISSYPSYLTTTSALPWSFGSTNLPVSSITTIKIPRLTKYSCSFRFCLNLDFVLFLPTCWAPPYHVAASTMSMTNSPAHHHSWKHDSTSLSSRKAKRSNSSRNVLLHYSTPLPPPDDWVLSQQDIVVEKNSNVRHAPMGRHARSATTCRQTLPLPVNHVTEPQATAPARTDVQRSRKPYMPSRCLNHMSARNCTAACIDTRPPPLPANVKLPPKAPSPPRLPTPDLSDVEEDDLWSCCMLSESNESSESNPTKDDLWNEMSRFYHHLATLAQVADDGV